MTNNEISVGRRKASVARVRFVKGKGKIVINNQDPLEYFKRESLVMEFKEPLTIVDFDNKSDILVNVKGGGLSGQAGAIRLGISRTLQGILEEGVFSEKLVLRPEAQYLDNETLKSMLNFGSSV